MIRGILFDLDGTLTDTLTDIAGAMNRALTLHGLPEYPVEAYKYLVGDGVKKLAMRAVRERQDLYPDVLRDYQAYYETHNQVQTDLYPGIAQTLAALAERGLTLCVFSNKPHNDTVNVVRRYMPEVPFRVIRGQMEGVPVKPDPAGALLTADEAGIEAGDFLYCGDTSTDMRCAVNAGMHPVGVTWGFRPEAELRENGAEYIIHHPMELLSVLDGMA